jgi:hypothetical protein
MGEGGAVRPDQVSLGVLVSAVARDAVDEAVTVCGVREKRSDAKLPAHVITYLTLALCLFPDDDYTEVATKVTGSLDRWNCCVDRHPSCRRSGWLTSVRLPMTV